jgi:hypothetical protein
VIEALLEIPGFLFEKASDFWKWNKARRLKAHQVRRVAAIKAERGQF